MKFTGKKLLAFVLTFAMMISTFAVSFTAFADESTDAVENKSLEYGDADLDGHLTIADAIACQKHLASLADLSDEALKLADVDVPFGELTLADVISIQKHLASLITEFPVEAQESSDSETDTATSSDSENTDSAISDSDSETATDSENKTTDTAASTDESTDSEQEHEGWLTLTEARRAGEGAHITLRGQVVYIYGTNTIILEEKIGSNVVSFQIYDKTGVSEDKYPINAVVEVTGTTSLYNEVLQISGPESVKTISENNQAIEPVEVTLDNLGSYLATYVLLKEVTVSDYDKDTQSSTVTDKNGKTVNLYRPATFPDGMTSSSVIDLACVPYSYKGETQIRVANTSDYYLGGYQSDDHSDSDEDSESENDMSNALDFLDYVIYMILDYGDDNNDLGLYAEESYSEFEKLYNEASKVLNDQSGYTASEVSELAYALYESWYYLELSGYGELYFSVEYILEVGDDTNSHGRYIEETYAQFHELYEKAVAMLEAGTATDAEMLEMSKQLDQAWEELPCTPYGNLYWLVYYIYSYGENTNDEGYYTEDSYAVFAQTLADAEALLASQTASDDEYTAQYEELLNDWKSLVEVEVEEAP